MVQSQDFGQDPKLSSSEGSSSFQTLPAALGQPLESESLAETKTYTEALSDFPASQESNETQTAQITEMDENVRLKEIRDTWGSMLKVSFQDGDAVYLVPTEFVDKVLFLENISSIDQLVTVVGKLDCSSLVDENGALPKEPTNGDPFTQIPPELFHQLVTFFGMQNDPVIRNVVIQDDGTPILERDPPYFVVHALTEASTQSKLYGGFDRSNQQSKYSFSLCQSKSFHHLVDAIKTCMLKGKNVDVRIWFVQSSDLESLPPTIPMSVFINEIDVKKLIGPQIMEQSLRSHGITSSRYHLVAECVNKTSRKFPVDSAISNYDLSVLNPSAILQTGGNLGLSNLGNTCYMNSALQCLVHLPEINHYFFFDLYERELNKLNPLGNKGEVAIAFSNLLHKLFDPHTSSASYVTPRDFKYTIGRYSSMFHGYQQQDSQEFLSWLLDALHEDLNRIMDKPYLEKPEIKDEDVDNHAAIRELAETCWSQHKQRNDSIITDLFTGLYQSTLVCPDCSKQSITFDPFNDLTLPLPISKKWYHSFTVVDLSQDSERAPISSLEVELSNTSNFEDLMKYLSDFLHVSPDYLCLFEVFRNYFYRNFRDGNSANKFLPVSELIGRDDSIVVYIIPHDPLKDLIIPLVNVVRDEDRSYDISEPFGVPLFIVLEKGSDTKSFGTIRAKVEQAVKTLTYSNMEARFNALKGDGPKKYHRAEDFPLLKGSTVAKDTVMVDVFQGAVIAEDEDEDAYDSDISLADPNISAALGFEIKLYEESSSSRASTYGRVTSDSSSSSMLTIPKGRPHFGNLPTLSQRLPDLKRSYYHYPEYVAEYEVSQAAEEESGNTIIDETSKETTNASSISSQTEKLDFVMVDKEESNCGEEGAEIENKESQIESFPGISNEEGTDSESGWDSVVPPFASTENLNSPKSPLSGISSGGRNPKVESFASQSSDKHPILVSEESMLVIEWDSQIYNQFFGDGEHQAWANPKHISNPKLEENRKILSKQQRSTISLYDCFRNFSTPEVLGEHDLWYCPRCKEHKRATKAIQLWSAGDLLTIHLKRFQSARQFSDKIDMVVDFPIEGLDMKEFVNSSPSDGEALLYDLVAVDEHYGGLGGGHYTACAKNFRDGKWYKFNDGRVSSIEDPQECVTGAAYLLFYKKRTSSTFAGGSGVENILRNGQSNFEAKIDNLRRHVEQVKQETESYNAQEEILRQSNEQIEDGPLEEEAPHQSDEEEDLYADSDSTEPDVPDVQRSSSKKSRSPTIEPSMKFEFENQRKQRLISKGSDSPRSININMGYSSSVSNLASPTGSTDGEATEQNMRE